MVALERLGRNTTLEEFYKFRDANKIVRNLANPPIKDTITVPDGGFTIIRFYTTNPGKYITIRRKKTENYPTPEVIHFTLFS